MEQRFKKLDALFNHLHQANSDCLWFWDRVKGRARFFRLLELQELPTTQENIKTLFDVWDYHVYSPSFYLNWKTQKIKKLIQRMCALYFYGCHVIKQIKDRIIQSLIIWFFTHNGNKTHRNTECCTWRRRCIKFFLFWHFFSMIHFRHEQSSIEHKFGNICQVFIPRS